MQIIFLFVTIVVMANGNQQLNNVTMETILMEMDANQTVLSHQLGAVKTLLTLNQFVIDVEMDYGQSQSRVMMETLTTLMVVRILVQ